MDDNTAPTTLVPPPTSPGSGASPDLSELTGRVNLPPELLRASGMKRLDWILSHPEPAEFVHQLAPQELFYWIRDIGKSDAYVLLEYATPEQLCSLVDIDAWMKNDLLVPRWLEWLDLALAVDVETAQRFLNAQDDETYLWMFTDGVQVLPADTDLDTIGDDRALFHTPDAMYVITVPRGHALEERIPQLMRLMWAADMKRVRVLLQQAQFELHSNTAEELIRFRTARLNELGFEAPIDALEVYAFEPPVPARERARAALNEAPPAARGLSQVLSHQSFDPVLRGVCPPDMLRAAIAELPAAERLRVGDGLAYLANKVFMADVGDLSRIEDLPDFSARAAGFANLGLTYLSDEHVPSAASILRREPVEHLFRVGYSLVQGLVRRARALSRKSGRTHGFEVFGAPTDEILTGLLQPRPLFFEGLDDEREVGWRAFVSLDDLAICTSWIEQAEIVLAWFEEGFGFSPDALAALSGLSDETRRRVRLDTLFRTGLANALVHDSFAFTPLTRETVAEFARMAFSRDGGVGPGLRPLLDSMSGSAEAVTRFTERAVDGLTDALGGVRPADIESNYASDLFLVADDTV